MGEPEEYQLPVPVKSLRRHRPPSVIGECVCVSDLRFTGDARGGQVMWRARLPQERRTEAERCDPCESPKAAPKRR